MNKIDIEKLRITQLKKYLVEVIKTISNDKNINADALDKKVGSYSLDKIPTDFEVTNFIIGVDIHRDVFLFRSRRNYSYNEIDNLTNIGFFEIFENVIRTNNKKGILPKIEGIETIKCLNTGTMKGAEVNTAEFTIQIEISYRTGGIKL